MPSRISSRRRLLPAKAISQDSYLGLRKVRTIRAGDTPSLGCVADFMPSERFTVHVDERNSSGSGWRARKSSVAETTGNNTTKMQPKKIKERMRASVSRAETERLPQIQRAGKASDNQSRFRSNSIAEPAGFLGPSVCVHVGRKSLDSDVLSEVSCSRKSVVRARKILKNDPKPA